MLPVENEVKARLYHGITREGLGRCDYLKKRLEKSPDDKYRIQQCSSWEYGWDMPKEMTAMPKKLAQAGYSTHMVYVRRLRSGATWPT